MQDFALKYNALEAQNHPTLNPGCPVIKLVQIPSRQVSFSCHMNAKTTLWKHGATRHYKSTALKYTIYNI